VSVRLALVAVLVAATAALAACNARMVGKQAPALVGTSWAGTSGAVAAPTLKERWILMEFFSPT
jgi:hypothetical protein